MRLLQGPHEDEGDPKGLCHLYHSCWAKREVLWYEASLGIHAFSELFPILNVTSSEITINLDSVSSQPRSRHQASIQPSTSLLSSLFDDFVRSRLALTTSISDYHFAF